MAYKTPGVYIEEISKFPPSVAEVETAVPAFIGYTEKAEQNGASLKNVPTKIMSLLEYQQLFGGGPSLTSVTVKVDKNNNYAATSVTPSPRFYMYEALRMFFDNGGGKCYIVSVGSYGDTVASGDESVTTSPGLRVGLKALEKYDEPTLILFPDAVLLGDTEFYTLQQLSLSQCARLQDRFSMFDLKESGAGWNQAVNGFRDAIGINNLKYGAAYTPWLRNSYARTVDFSLFSDTVKDGANAAIDLEKITADSNLNALVSGAKRASADQAVINATVATLRGASPTIKDRYLALKNAIDAATTDDARKTAFQAVLGFLRQTAVQLAKWPADLKGANLKLDLKTYALSTLRPALLKIIAIEKNTDVLAISDVADAAAVNAKYIDLDATAWLPDANADGKMVEEIAADTTDFNAGGATVAQTINAILLQLDNSVLGARSTTAFVSQIQGAAQTHSGLAQSALYQGHPIIANIVSAINKEMANVPPTGAVAGVYAYVDSSRGVWKAPANVSLSAVSQPSVPIDFFDQEDLNVDVTGGKSINAIRTFTGLGTLVWGARTLAGNDNEWRYVPVRRFFIMVEESVKKSTGWAVFEPNDANLWTKVKSMIDNYLIQKWREGALAGATPDQAFYVKVGLGQTMTAQDILEGRLIIEIGMAVVRPAEFIILRFAHKMQES
jgi:phage tail sheath protein FI